MRTGDCRPVEHCALQHTSLRRCLLNMSATHPFTHQYHRFCPMPHAGDLVTRFYCWLLTLSGNSRTFVFARTARCKRHPRLKLIPFEENMITVFIIFWKPGSLSSAESKFYRLDMYACPAKNYGEIFHWETSGWVLHAIDITSDSLHCHIKTNNGYLFLYFCKFDNLIHTALITDILTIYILWNFTYSSLKNTFIKTYFYQVQTINRSISIPLYVDIILQSSDI